MEIENSKVLDNPIEALPPTLQTPITFGKGLWLSIQFILIQIAVAIPVMVVGMGIYGMEDQAGINNFLMFVGLPLGFIFGAWFLYRKRGLIETAFQWKSNFILLSVLGLLMMYGITYIIGEISTYLPGYEAMLEMYESMFAGIHPMALLIGGAFIGPICEEIVFRGIILEGLSRKYNPTKAIVFSALIFGLIHLQPLQVIGAFFSGLVLGWIYWKTQSLWIVIILHIVNNFVAFTLEDIGTDSTRSYFDNDLLYIGSFLLAAVIAYLAYLGFTKLMSKEIPVHHA